MRARLPCLPKPGTLRDSRPTISGERSSDERTGSIDYRFQPRIGKQLGQDFAAHGYDIVALARSTGDAPSALPGTIDDTAEIVRAYGRPCLPLGVDLSRDDGIAPAVERAYEQFGRIDVLINNAGIGPPGPALEAPARRWSLAMAINLNAFPSCSCTPSARAWWRRRVAG